VNVAGAGRTVGRRSFRRRRRRIATTLCLLVLTLARWKLDRVGYPFVDADADAAPR
jgi:hypothetical protein